MSFKSKINVDCAGRTVVITGASGATGGSMAGAFAAKSGVINFSKVMLSHIPQHRPGNPSDIATAALYVGSDEAASYLTGGAVLTVNGGWTCGYARDF